MHTNVASVVTASGQWDMSRLSFLLLDDIVSRIVAVQPPHPALGSDESRGLFEFLVEVWGVHNILLHAWRLGLLSIELETGSLLVERSLHGTSRALFGNALVDDVRELMSRE
ncbi:hypothetical protein V6N12_047254 [Hibiscus sabdariffa]|uniref:Uncharacterized protein n=1 Tax=Hibiscus sabdariffa TaxID=183260 RepID=A0ABR2DD92_9ROSI